MDREPREPLDDLPSSELRLHGIASDCERCTGLGGMFTDPELWSFKEPRGEHRLGTLRAMGSKSMSSDARPLLSLSRAGVMSCWAGKDSVSGDDVYGEFAK